MTDQPAPSVVLTQRFADAVAYASDLHRDQARNVVAIPYMSHLLGSASYLLEQPDITEDQAIAALLHDAIEDQAERTSVAAITARFGPDVARMVLDCSDSDGVDKAPWEARKTAYLAHLETVAIDSLQVSLADKLHNGRSIVADLLTVGPDLWDRFNAARDRQRWYYTSLAEVFSRRLPGRMSTIFAATVKEMFSDAPTDSGATTG